ncbi:ABC transporter ATP-binding protein [Celeribacter indicus]|uniref:Oligopeptide/dipeptide ABC transporter, ATPase subunit n=1 Tax=Celeribacter indicus TaxID=1208324 RepID=A0A0B5DTV6_9RHOB|nr:ABC transporter ATP-binding protein [Celeribacter indicus]AJE46878.1 oligopeptide/dipeptide ABC transporter, ATPase subunit [Celeribacter indicus]SDW79630.1 peptide/nickel transport system ATP-binding protein [Celeribacter indicus]
MAYAHPTPILELRDLCVEFDTMAGLVQGLRGVSLSLMPGETLALVGESGSGKSVTAQAIMGLIGLPGRIASGDILWKGQSLLTAEGRRTAQRLRGKSLSMVFQDPMTSLNPLMTIGAHLVEVLRRHMKLSKAAAFARGVELLDAVGITEPRRRMGQYPHEFSGGMRQRVMIALAIACEPELLIADEPTTALDVTIQAQVLDLLADLQTSMGLSILLITHDLGIVAGLCEKVAVMYAGSIVEAGTARTVFGQAEHPYTQGLIRSTPRLDDRRERLVAIDGAPPSLLDPPKGCAFQSRCPVASRKCDTTPVRQRTPEGGSVSCWTPAVPAWSEPAPEARAR